MRVFAILFFISIGCGGVVNYKDNFTITQVEDLDELFAVPFSSLKNQIISFNNAELTIKDTLLEDEGIKWRGLNFYYHDTYLFMVENSWKQNDSVNTVTVCSGLLKTSSNVSVGYPFKSIKDLVNFNSWTDFPDGYIMFKDINTPRLIYNMDVRDGSELLKMPLSKNSFPDTVKIASILLK